MTFPVDRPGHDEAGTPDTGTPDTGTPKAGQPTAGPPDTGSPDTGPPTVHVYALCWNERPVLPYFFRHYDEVGAEYFILDDSSSDGSTELLDAHPRVTWESYRVEGDSFVAHARRLYDEVWKQSRGQADWVVVCNIDEHLWSPDLAGTLTSASALGYTLLPATGYQMVTLWRPRRDKRLADTARRGARWTKMDKTEVFDPDEIDEIGFAPGRHSCAPSGNVVAPAEPALALLHYKMLGPWYDHRRAREIDRRLRPGDKARGIGRRYARSTLRLLRDYQYVLRTSGPVPAPVAVQAPGPIAP